MANYLNYYNFRHFVTRRAYIKARQCDTNRQVRSKIKCTAAYCALRVYRVVCYVPTEVSKRSCVQFTRQQRLRVLRPKFQEEASETYQNKIAESFLSEVYRAKIIQVRSFSQLKYGSARTYTTRRKHESCSWKNFKPSRFSRKRQFKTQATQPVPHNSSLNPSFMRRKKKSNQISQSATFSQAFLCANFNMLKTGT